jgi:Fe-S-cluster containining protein
MVGAGGERRSKVLMKIAGLCVELHDVGGVLADLDAVYGEFDTRSAAYARTPSNPHLCFAGCSHCCRRGAFFAVTLVEALRWTLAVAGLPEPLAARVRTESMRLLELQREAFGEDSPGNRDEETFSARVARVAAAGPACPLLEDDRCSVYANRPFLCRAYGFPVDAYAVETETAIAFRSLCHLYEGLALADWVPARDLRARLGELSRRLAGGAELGRFTSAEAILARVEGE